MAVYCSICKQVIEEAEYVVGSSIIVSIKSPSGSIARKTITKRTEPVPAEIGIQGQDSMGIHLTCNEQYLKDLGYIENEGVVIRPRAANNY